MAAASDRRATRTERWSRYALVVLAVFGAIIAFTPRGQIRPDLGTGIGDKAAHAVFASFLGVLFALALPRVGTLLHLLLLIVIAVTVECVQPLFGRAMDFDDGFMTLLGAWGGFAFGRLVFGRRSSSEQALE